MDHDAVRRTIAQRVLDQLDELLPQMGATYQAEVEEYARLTPEQLEHEVLRTSRRIVEAYFGRLSARRDTSKVDLSDLARAGRRRLEMGITLDSAMHAFRLAGRETWKAVVAAVRPGEETAVAELAAGWIDYMDRASSSFADGYLDTLAAWIHDPDTEPAVAGGPPEQLISATPAPDAPWYATARAHVLVLALAGCKVAPPDRTAQLIAKGRDLFFNETFNGNGRTCGTCHRAEANFSIHPAFIATLPPSDALFVAEFTPALKENFENPRLMREFALILENLDGFDDLANRFVMRGVPHTLALRTSVASAAGPRTGWSGDGAPGDRSLRAFAVGAVIQHFTKRLDRVAGTGLTFAFGLLFAGLLAGGDLAKDAV